MSNDVVNIETPVSIKVIMSPCLFQGYTPVKIRLNDQEFIELKKGNTHTFVTFKTVNSLYIRRGCFRKKIIIATPERKKITFIIGDLTYIVPAIGWIFASILFSDYCCEVSLKDCLVWGALLWLPLLAIASYIYDSYILVYRMDE